MTAENKPTMWVYIMDHEQGRVIKHKVPESMVDIIEGSYEGYNKLMDKLCSTYEITPDNYLVTSSDKLLECPFPD